MNAEERAAYYAADRRLERIGALVGYVSAALFCLVAAGVLAAWLLDLKPPS